MNKIIDDFAFIDPEILDLWFEKKMEKYKNSPLGNNLKKIYLMLTDDSIRDDTLLSFYHEEGWD